MYVHTASQFWTTDPLGAPTVEVHQTNGHGFWVLVFSASGGARFCLESFAEKEYLLTLMKISTISGWECVSDKKGSFSQRKQSLFIFLHVVYFQCEHNSHYKKNTSFMGFSGSVSVVHKKISDVQKTPEHWGCLHIIFNDYSISKFVPIICDMTRNINSVKRGQLELNLSINYFTTLTHCYDDENFNDAIISSCTEHLVYQGCSESSFVYIAMCLKILCVDSKGLCLTGYHKERIWWFPVG